MAVIKKPIIDSNSVDKAEYRIYVTEGNVAVVAVSKSEASIIEKVREKYKGKPIPDKETVQGILLKIRSGKHYIANQVIHDFKINELISANEVWD